MSTPLPTKWHKPDAPEDGIYTLVTITGYESPDGTDYRPLYVVSSDEGFLSEAFTFTDPRWTPYYERRATADADIAVESVDEAVAKHEQYARNQMSYGKDGGELNPDGIRVRDMLLFLRDMLEEDEYNC